MRSLGTRMNGPGYAWVARMALRDTRRSRGKLALLAFAVIFGVAALVAVNSLRGNLEKEVERQSLALLGSDLEFRSSEPFTSEIEAFLEGLGAVEEALDTRLSTMAYFVKSEETRLVSVRAMEGAFPWYGTLDTRPGNLTLDPENGRVALVEESLMIQYNLEIGDSIKIGDALFEVIGEVLRIPGESSLGSSFSPRVLIPHAYLAETNLLGFGSRQSYRKHFLFENGLDEPLSELLQEKKESLRLGNVQFDTVKEQERRIGNTLGEMTSYLSLVGFVALLLGGVGIAGAVQVYLKEKSQSMAVLRCLGCRSGLSMAIFSIQIVVVGFIGCLLGAAIGIAVQAVLPQVVQAFIPFELPFEIVWGSVLEAFAFAWLLTALFSFLPLLPLRKLSPMQAIRSSIEAEISRRDWLIYLVVGAIAVLSFAFAYLQTESVGEAAGIFAGLVVAMLVLAGLGVAFRSALRLLSTRTWSFVWRQGLSNLYRPNNSTVSLVVMIGMGAFLIYSLYLCEVSILKRGEINDSGESPNAVFFDVQNDQVAGVKQLIEDAGIALKFHDTIVTMRLTHLRDQAVETLQRDETLELEPWALRREYRSTYRGELREHETLVEGEFVAESSLDGPTPIPVSVEERIVKALDLKLGDLMRWDVQGFPIDTVVTSIRKVDWRQMRPNFFVIFPNGVLEPAPATSMIAIREADIESVTSIQSAVVRAFPNVSTINLSSVLESLQEVFDKIGFVIRFMASFTILTGLIALTSMVLTSRYQRMRESVLLRSLGARVGQVRCIMGIEYFLLGGIGSATGVALSLAGAWAMTRFVFKVDLYVPWGMTVAAIVIIGTLTFVTGMLNSLGIAKRSPLEALRYD